MRTEEEAKELYDQYSYLIYDKLHHLLDCCDDDVDIQTPIESLIKECALIALKREQNALISYGEDSDELQNMDSILRWYDRLEDEVCSL